MSSHMLDTTKIGIYISYRIFPGVNIQYATVSSASPEQGQNTNEYFQCIMSCPCNGMSSDTHFRQHHIQKHETTLMPLLVFTEVYLS